MAVKRKIPLNQIDGVAAGGTATIKLPTNVRYHAIYFQYGTATAGGPTEANIEAELTEWRLNIDGVTQRKASSAQIFDINRSKGLAPVVGATAGYVPFFFSEPQREGLRAQESTAWGMKDVNTFQIEVDIAAGAASPTLSAFAVVDDILEPPGGIVKWKREIIQVAAIGELTHQLDTGKGDSYQGLYFFEGAAGDINSLRLEWDGVKLWDIDENDDNALLPYLGATVVSGMVHVPLDDNFPADAVPMVKMINGNPVKVQEFMATLNMGAANNVTLLREVIGSPD